MLGYRIVDERVDGNVIRLRREERDTAHNQLTGNNENDESPCKSSGNDIAPRMVPENIEIGARLLSKRLTPCRAGN